MLGISRESRGTQSDTRFFERRGDDARFVAHFFLERKRARVTVKDLVAEARGNTTHSIPAPLAIQKRGASLSRSVAYLRERRRFIAAAQ